MLLCLSGGGGVLVQQLLLPPGIFVIQLMLYCNAEIKLRSDEALLVPQNLVKPLLLSRQFTGISRVDVQLENPQ